MTTFFSIVLGISLLLSTFAQAESPVDDNKTNNDFKWGQVIPLPVNGSDLKIRIGTRLQAIVENNDFESASTGIDMSNQDFYIRRARLQVGTEFRKNFSTYFDIRADKVDHGNSGKNGFALGDAFFQVKNLFGSESLRLRFLRAKYDISRSETVSSSNLLTPTRTKIADFAAEFISEARRGSNLQLLANWKGRLQGQLVAGDSQSTKSFRDALGQNSATLNRQNFAYGARLRISPFPGWEDDKLTETFHGQGKHFTIGAGYYQVDKLSFTAGTTDYEIDRKLSNFEMSFHYGPFSFASEYFIFDGVVDNFAATNVLEGQSEGWFAQVEYVFNGEHQLAPFARYQYWDRFSGRNDFAERTTLAGLNYYIIGNKLRFGIYYESSEYEDGLAASGEFARNEKITGLNMMIHY